jgi:cytidyltransferase-like protein
MATILSIVFCILGTLLGSVMYILCRLTYAVLFPTIVPYPWPEGKPNASSYDHRSSSSGSSQSKTSTPRFRFYRRPPPLYNQATTVVLAGSFNPPHLGHVAMIRYLSQQYQRVIVVIGCNPHKVYTVSPSQRAALLRQILRYPSSSFSSSTTTSTSSTTTTSSSSSSSSSPVGVFAARVSYANVHVQIVEGYIWKIVQRQGAQLFVRGIRSWAQDGPDERKLQWQNIWGPLVLGPLWYPLPTLYLQGIPKYNHISSTYIRTIIQQYSNNNNSSTSTSTSTSNENENNDGTTTKKNPVPNAVCRNHLLALVPEAIVDDVWQLYG